MSSGGVKRLQKELQDIIRDPNPLTDARPTNDIFKWFFVLYGAAGTPYDGGQYLGRLEFPQDYPFRPPAIRMITPNGRFQTNMRLCLSISDYHPESWSPMWRVSTIISGALSFMNDKASTLGAIETSDEEKKRLARESPTFNLNCKDFCRFLPHHVDKAKALEASSRQSLKRTPSSSQTDNSPPAKRSRTQSP